MARIPPTRSPFEKPGMGLPAGAAALLAQAQQPQEVPVIRETILAGVAGIGAVFAVGNNNQPLVHLQFDQVYGPVAERVTVPFGIDALEAWAHSLIETVKTVRAQLAGDQPSPGAPDEEAVAFQDAPPASPTEGWIVEDGALVPDPAPRPPLSLVDTPAPADPAELPATS